MERLCVFAAIVFALAPLAFANDPTETPTPTQTPLPCVTSVVPVATKVGEWSSVEFDWIAAPMLSCGGTLRLGGNSMLFNGILYALDKNNQFILLQTNVLDICGSFPWTCAVSWPAQANISAGTAVFNGYTGGPPETIFSVEQVCYAVATCSPTDSPTPTATSTSPASPSPAGTPTNTPTRAYVAQSFVVTGEGAPLDLAADPVAGYYGVGINSDAIDYTGALPTPPTLTFEISQPTPIAIQDLGGGAYECVWTTDGDPARIRNVFQITVSGAPANEVEFVPYAVLTAIIRDDTFDLQNNSAVGLGTPVTAYEVFRFDPGSGAIHPLPQVGTPIPTPVGNDNGTDLYQAQATITQIQSIYGAAQSYVVTPDWVAY